MSAGAPDQLGRGAAHVAHLARRFAGSLSRRPPAAEDVAWAMDHLLAPEAELWRRFAPADQRHTIEVARRFAASRPGATRAEVAGALLHDIGKLDADLGTLGRVVATVVGPRTDRFRRYHDHEAVGARWCEQAGSDAVTVALVRGEGDAASALRAADHT